MLCSVLHTNFYYVCQDIAREAGFLDVLVKKVVALHDELQEHLAPSVCDAKSRSLFTHFIDRVAKFYNPHPPHSRCTMTTSTS